MSKAEERALEVYPPKLVTYSDLFGEETLDDNGLKRTVFVKGYHQAEKDLELTCEDIKTIDKLLNQCVDYSNPYQEVLKRFKTQKGE